MKFKIPKSYLDEKVSHIIKRFEVPMDGTGISFETICVVGNSIIGGYRPIRLIQLDGSSNGDVISIILGWISSDSNIHSARVLEHNPSYIGGLNRFISVNESVPFDSNILKSTLISDENRNALETILFSHGNSIFIIQSNSNSIIILSSDSYITSQYKRLFGIKEENPFRNIVIDYD